MAPSPAVTRMAVLQVSLSMLASPPCWALRMVTGVELEAFLKDVWRHDVAVAGDAVEDHHRLGDFVFVAWGARVD